jgi:hypothetical protein
MSTNENVSKFFHNGCDIDEKFLNPHDSVVTPVKSQNAYISLGMSAGPTGADVTLVSTTPSYEEKMRSCRADCTTLRKTALRRKYSFEAIAHRNMLVRSKSQVNTRFRKFADFLFEVGPKPFPKATLDRIYNSDPEYAPGKVRWADAHTQSNNRSTSRLFDDPDGNQYTVAQLAKRQNVSPNAIHQRLRRGWSYPQIVEGDRSLPGPISPATPPNLVKESKEAAIFVIIPDLKPVWRQEMDAAYEGEWHDLSGRDKKGLRNIAERCAVAGLGFYEEEVLRHAIKAWSWFTARAKSEEGAYGIPEKPTVDFLEKYIRVAVNLFLEENDLEFKNSTVRPREKSCALPQAVAARAPLTTAPVPQQAFRELPYDPPALPLNPKEWQALSAEEKDRTAGRDAEKYIGPYNAKYTKYTGKLPPEEFHCPLNIEAVLSYLYPRAGTMSGSGLQLTATSGALGPSEVEAWPDDHGRGLLCERRGVSLP